MKPITVIGSAQKNAYVGSVNNVCSCITAACGMGGGQIPMVIYEIQHKALIVQRPHGFNKGGVFTDCAPTITTSDWQDNNLLVEIWDQP